MLINYFGRLSELTSLRQRLPLAFVACCSMTTSVIGADPPLAILSGATIRLKAPALSFILPSAWMEWWHEEHNNLHLDRAEMRKVEAASGGFDADYARVINAVLPFERCVVHAGGEGWGSESRSVADLQMRVYLGDWSRKALDRLIAEEGVPKATDISYREVSGSYRQVSGTSENISYVKNIVADWHHRVIRFPVKYRDNVDEVESGANIEFFFRSFGKATVVVIFMYADPCAQKEYMEGILSSFKYDQ